MQRSTLALAFPLVSCDDADRAELISGAVPDERVLDAGAEGSDARERVAVLVREGLAGAAVLTPPPPVGSMMPALRITRPDRSADDLAYRLAAVLDAMDLEAEPLAVSAWAGGAADAREPDVAEVALGVVVVYDPELDDMMVVSTSLLDMQTRIAVDAVPWPVARRVIHDLIFDGVAPSSSWTDVPAIAYVRSGAKGPDGTSEHWVDEVLFASTMQMGGIDVVDAGLRIGVTPTGKISSVQLTGALVERVSRTAIDTSMEDLEAALAQHIAGSVPDIEAVQITDARPVYMLHAGATSELVAPRYLIVYSVDVGNGEARTTSRRVVTVWSMTAPELSVEVLP